jgi:hypothetical protein
MSEIVWIYANALKCDGRDHSKYFFLLALMKQRGFIAIPYVAYGLN